MPLIIVHLFALSTAAAATRPRRLGVWDPTSRVRLTSNNITASGSQKLDEISALIRSLPGRWECSPWELFALYATTGVLLTTTDYVCAPRKDEPLRFGMGSWSHLLTWRINH